MPTKFRWTAGAESMRRGRGVKLPSRKMTAVDLFVNRLGDTELVNNDVSPLWGPSAPRGDVGEAAAVSGTSPGPFGKPAAI